MKNKKGISLIVLVITIVVIIILAATVILTMANNNPIAKANKAKFYNDVSELKNALTLKISDSYLTSQDYNFDPSDYNETDITKVLAGVDMFKGKLEIVEGKIVYVPGKCSELDVEWFEDLGIKPKGKLSDEEIIDKMKNSDRVYDNIEVEASKNKMTEDFNYDGYGADMSGHTIEEWIEIFEKAEKENKVLHGETTLKDAYTELQWASPNKTGWAMAKILCDFSEQEGHKRPYNYLLKFDLNDSNEYDFILNTSYPKPEMGCNYEVIVFRVTPKMVEQGFVYTFFGIDRPVDTTPEDKGQVVHRSLRIIYDDEVAI